MGLEVEAGSALSEPAVPMGEDDGGGDDRGAAAVAAGADRRPRSARGSLLAWARPLGWGTTHGGGGSGAFWDAGGMVWEGWCHADPIYFFFESAHAASVPPRFEKSRTLHVRHSSDRRSVGNCYKFSVIISWRTRPLPTASPPPQRAHRWCNRATLQRGGASPNETGRRLAPAPARRGAARAAARRAPPAGRNGRRHPCLRPLPGGGLSMTTLTLQRDSELPGGLASFPAAPSSIPSRATRRSPAPAQGAVCPAPAWARGGGGAVPLPAGRPPPRHVRGAHRGAGAAGAPLPPPWSCRVV